MDSEFLWSLRTKHNFTFSEGRVPGVHEFDSQKLELEHGEPLGRCGASLRLKESECERGGESGIVVSRISNFAGILNLVLRELQRFHADAFAVVFKAASPGRVGSADSRWKFQMHHAP